MKAWLVYIFVMLFMNVAISGLICSFIYLAVSNITIFYIVPFVSLVVFLLYDLVICSITGSLRYYINEINKILNS